MPTYDYVCDACGHEEEIFQSITADVIKRCPSCKKSKFRRLFGTGAAIMFKGSGFYQTDYRSESYKKAAEKDSKASEGSTSSTDNGAAASDSKSPTKSSSSDSAPTPKQSDSPKKKKKD